MTQAELPIVTQQTSDASYGNGKKRLKGEVLIGNGNYNSSLYQKATENSQLREDGFLLTTEDGNLRILSGGDRGSIYGVVSLLERYCNVNYWGEREYSLTETDDLQLPKLHVVDNPAFRYRQNREAKVKYVGIKHVFDKKTSARYIRVDVEGVKICPHWHYGVGKVCWFFLDELIVR